MKKAEEVEDISELEEEIEEAEETDESQFQQFIEIPTGEFITPTLEQINQPFAIPDLEQNVAFTSTEKSPKTSKIYEFTTEEEAKRYESGSPGMEPPILRTNIDLQQTRFLDPFEGRNIQRFDEMEQRIMKTRTKTERRKLPFEKDEDKYKEVKL